MFEKLFPQFLLKYQLKPLISLNYINISSTSHNPKIKILDQLWRMVKPGECREESLHGVELLCATIMAIMNLGEHKIVTQEEKEVRNEFSSSPILYFSRYYINSFIISINNHARLCFRHFFYVFLQSIINRYIR